MRVYGNCGTMPHTTARPTPTLTDKKHPPKSTALGADLLKAPGHIDHIGKKRGPRAKVVPPKTCLQCGNEFNKPPNLSSYNWGRREFCSVACSNISRKAAR